MRRAVKRLASTFNIREKQRKGRSLYFDSAATTPIDFRVLDAMLPFLTANFGNPHSRSHAYGWEAEKAVEGAREAVAQMIGAVPKEIVFTSGATESNNLAIKGVARFHRGKRRHLITTQVEHKCVLDSFRSLEAEGFEVSYLPVDAHGRLEISTVEAALRPDTLLLSVLAVNNEIGAVQDLAALGRLCRAHSVFFHTDAAQAAGKIPLDVQEMNIDLLSVSGHKIYGPKGVGALYVRRQPRVRLTPLFSGGGQERGMRSGTLPAALCVGLGTAARIASEEQEFDLAHVSALRKALLDGLWERIPRLRLNGDLEGGYPGIVNISFECVEGESLIMAARNVAVSSGSACTSASLEPSYVLRSLGVSEELAHTSIRFSLSRFTTVAEVNFLVELLADRVQTLRDLSPLWESDDGVESVCWTGGGKSS